jgi:hypothetical protein
VPTLQPYDYVVVRVVPWVERQEFINVGVILYCRTQQFLGARVALDVRRLRALAPGCDVAAIEAQLALLPRFCAGEGPMCGLSLVERFRWLAAPRSTVVQVSSPHRGLCLDAAATLDRLLYETVRLPGAG